MIVTRPPTARLAAQIGHAMTFDRSYLLDAHVTLNNPEDDDRTAVPAYDGPARAAHTVLAPGTYTCTVALDGDTETGTLVVTYGAHSYVTTEDEDVALDGGLPIADPQTPIEIPDPYDPDGDHVAYRGPIDGAHVVLPVGRWSAFWAPADPTLRHTGVHYLITVYPHGASDGVRVA